MSKLCPASYSIASFNDLEEITQIQSSTFQQLLERHIDISLNCKLTINGPRNSDCKLEILGWKNGSTDLCGSCSFCDLLADGIQRNVESDLKTSWNLTSNLLCRRPTPSHRSQYKAIAHFNKLEYQICRSSDLLTRLPSESLGNHWNMFFLLLTGFIEISHPNDDEEPIQVEVDLLFEIFGEEDDPLVEQLRIHRRPLHTPRLSTENVAIIQSWLGDCNENHLGCWRDLRSADNNARHETTAFLPTRLIDVGDASNRQSPRLVLTSTIQQHGAGRQRRKYIALSYCWGPITQENKLLKTTHATINSRMEGIEFQIMPRTFQDAIITARKLGVQYLWIDSLCIIQGDARDWQIESSKMEEIYSSAYLVLAIASGSSCDDGFLTPSRPIPSCRIPLALRTPETGALTQGHISIRFCRRENPFPADDKMSDIIASSWLSRGWTFQEERLARRTLMFGESKFFFDCRTLERAQHTDTYKLRPHWASLTVPYPYPYLEDEHGIGIEEGGKPDGWWDQWQTICTQYSYRKLTYPEDKLPAISGIAYRAAGKMNARYRAGLWAENLMHDLFWQTVDKGVVTKPSSYRAPSWSWAALDGRVSWKAWEEFVGCKGGCVAYCTVLDSWTELAGLDPFGGVKDGGLKIRGRVENVDVRWDGGDERCEWGLYSRGQRIGDVDLDFQKDDAKVDDDELVTHPQALLAAECKSSQEKKGLVRGLLLEKTGGQREGYEEFRRVGTFTLFPGVLTDRENHDGIWREDEERIILIV